MIRSAWQGRGSEHAQPEVRWPTPLAGPRHRWRVAWLTDIVCRFSSGGPVVDVGCGYGALSGALAARGLTVVALDVDAGCLDHVRKAAANAGLQTRLAVLMASVCALPLPSDWATIVVAGEVIEHVADDGLAMREMARILRPGGHLVLTTPSGARRFGHGDRLAGHYRRYDRSQLIQLASLAGLEIQTLRGWGFPFGRLYERWVQHSVLRLKGQPIVGFLAERVTETPPLRWVEGLFRLEARWPAGALGCGWLLVARRA